MSPRRLLVSIIVIFSLVLLHVAVQADEQSNVCVCMKEDDIPTLKQLIHLNVPEKDISIRIMQEIGTKYDTVGTFLLEDNHGKIIAGIRNDLRMTEQVVHEIFRRWIDSGKSVTWRTLVNSLRASELYSLADHIETVIQFCAEKNLDLNCPVKSSEYFYDISSITYSLWNVTMMVSSILFPIVIGFAIFFQCSVKAKKQHSSPSVTQSVPPPVTQPDPPTVTKPPPAVTQPDPPPVTQPVTPQPDLPAVTQPVLPLVTQPVPPQVTQPVPSAVTQPAPPQPDLPAVTQSDPAVIQSVPTAATQPVLPSATQPLSTQPVHTPVIRYIPPAVPQPVPPAVTMHIPPPITQHIRPPITQPDPPPITKLVYNKYLRKLYKRIIRRGPACEDDWPPPIIKKYFNLAMIEEKDVNRYGNRDVYTRKLESGKVEDILKNKVPIELEKISEEMKGCDGKVFLLEGALGCGKSTLALHITKQWEEGKLFQEYEHVVLVKLRDNNVFNAKKLADILPKKNKEMGPEIEKELIVDDGRHVLFILDGWDELPETAPGHSLIMDILNKEELSGSSILITSRPTSSSSLYKLVDCRIEILGFSQEELKRYFSDNLDCGEKLLRKIQENPAVASSCYVPLYASILVHVFKATGELPKTQYGIFSSLIRNCIYRHQKKTKQAISPIKSLDELPEKVKGQFGKLCLLAYDAIMEDRIIFNDLGRDFNTLGLLQGVENLTDGGESLSHNFLHLSIQELLAALHMATQLNPEQQVAQFRELFGRARFAAVFSFYAAKTKLKTAGMDQVLVEAVKKCLNNTRVTKLTESASDDSDSDEEPKPLLLSLMACLYEAEDETLYHSIVKQFTDSKLNLSRISLKPFDCLILGRFLAHCKQFIVNLLSCSIHAEECKTLFKPDEEYDLLSLNLNENSIGDEGAVAISEAMKTMTNLQVLLLEGNSIGDEGAVAISEAMKTMTNLQVLLLRSNSIGAEGAVAISEAMKTMTNLKELYLQRNSIGDEGAVAISEAMKTMTNLQELSLWDNSIGDKGAVAISEAMKTMTNLKTLVLNENSIGAEGAVAISEAMKTMTNLKTLVLGGNSAITKVGREAVEEAAKLSGTKIWV